jgi:phage tail-like protein
VSFAGGSNGRQPANGHGGPSANGHDGSAGLGNGPPAVASLRAYLRAAMPSAYQEGGFGMRFLAGLEPSLDPIVALLDSLPAYLSPSLAPEQLLQLMANWLGLVIDEGTPPDVLRSLVLLAPELNRWRATQAGLELLLRLTFPRIELTVEDAGCALVLDEAQAPPPPAPPAFTVRCAGSLNDEQRAAVVRVIERERPVHVAYRLLESAAPEREGVA